MSLPNRVLVVGRMSPRLTQQLRLYTTLLGTAAEVVFIDDKQQKPVDDMLTCIVDDFDFRKDFSTPPKKKQLPYYYGRRRW